MWRMFSHAPKHAPKRCPLGCGGCMSGPVQGRRGACRNAVGDKPVARWGCGDGSNAARELRGQVRGSSPGAGLTGGSDRNFPLVAGAVMRGCSGMPGPHRTKPDAACLGQCLSRDKPETLKPKRGAVSRVSRLSRAEIGRVRVETGKRAGHRVRERVLSREPLCIYPRHPRHPRQSSGARLSASRACLGWRTYPRQLVASGSASVSASSSGKSALNSARLCR